MIGPLHTLKHEHRVIERTLRALDGMCKRLLWGEHVSADALAQVVDFISAYADGFHHKKEEEYLFPALAEQGIAIEGGPLGVMNRQHECERELTSEMIAAIEAYRSLDTHASSRFVEAAIKYIDFLIAHMEKEDSMLFRLADELLEDEEKTALGEAFKQAEQLLTRRTVQEYEQIASALEERWGV